MGSNTEFRKVSISPMSLWQESLSLMGDQYWLFVGVTFVGLLIAGLVPFGILMGPMMCGIYLCFFLRLKGQEASFETLFKGFDYFVESFIATLIVMAVSVLALLPFIIMLIIASIAMSASGDGESGAVFALPFVLMSYLGIVIVSILASMCFLFIYPLIVDRQLSALDAVKTSAKAVMANLGGIALLTLMNAVVSTLAACACVVPTYLFLPIALGTTALLYRDIFSK